ncbi:MAG: hypothetical protein C4334_11605 [Pyrinomonas sp.]
MESNEFFEQIARVARTTSSKRSSSDGSNEYFERAARFTALSRPSLSAARLTKRVHLFLKGEGKIRCAARGLPCTPKAEALHHLTERPFIRRQAVS